jgi:hypothetical protein
MLTPTFVTLRSSGKLESEVKSLLDRQIRAQRYRHPAPVWSDLYTGPHSTASAHPLESPDRQRLPLEVEAALFT